MSKLPIPTVNIDHKGGYKFILARVTNQYGRSRLVVWGDKNLGYHRDIFSKLRKKMPRNFEISCLGGGHIRANLYEETGWYGSGDGVVKGTIQLSRDSGDYGFEPRHHTLRILKKHYPHVKISVEW